MGTAIERLATLIRRGFAGHADGHENFPVERALAHRVVAVISEEDRFVRTDGRAVSALENAVAPRAKKVAVAIKNNHRVLTARKAVNLVFVVHRNRCDFVKGPIAGQFAEALDHFVTIITAAYDRTHDNLLAFAVQSLQSSDLSLTRDPRP